MRPSARFVIVQKGIYTQDVFPVQRRRNERTTLEGAKARAQRLSDKDIDG